MKLQFDADDLRPLVETVVREVLDQSQSDQARLNGRLAFTEPESAALLGVAPHVLRDCRLRGEISGSRVGKRILYARNDLLKLLIANRT